MGRRPRRDAAHTKLVVADTSAWIDYFRGASTPEVDALDGLIREGLAGLTDIVYGEVLQGAKHERDANRYARNLRPLRMLRLEGLADFEAAAGLYRRARAAGTPVRRGVDCLIAAVCIREDVAILHRDADFDRLAACTQLRVFSQGLRKAPS